MPRARKAPKKEPKEKKKNSGKTVEEPEEILSSPEQKQEAKPELKPESELKPELRQEKSDKEKSQALLQKELISFLQEQGFIWGPSPEIYGGFSGFYTYGPLGKLLKNKVENIVRKTLQSHCFSEVECPIIMPDIVWKASGHLDTFVDKAVKCEKCNSLFRVDKILEMENQSGKNFSDQEMLEFIQKNHIKCPSCDSNLKYDIINVNLMMKTNVAGQPASLRPETATTTYLPFRRLYQFARKKLPFGVFQIGKAFRNEVSPRQHILRSREFTQAEAQIFINPKEKNEWPEFEKIKNTLLPLIPYNTIQSMISLEKALSKKFIQTKSYAYCIYLAYLVFRNMGFTDKNMKIRQHAPDERAFYAEDAWDIEINLKTFGWTEVCGIHDRTDYDLVQHEKFSKQNLTALDENNNVVKPHILEIAFGIDRPLFALLDNCYEKRAKEQGKTLLNLPYPLAPIDVAILPLMKDDNLKRKAMHVKSELEKEFVVVYDESGSIGKRYLRNTTIGTPYCITIDFEPGITVRERNTGKQIRIKTNEIEAVKKLLANEIAFEKAGEIIKKSEKPE